MPEQKTSQPKLSQFFTKKLSPDKAASVPTIDCRPQPPKPSPISQKSLDRNAKNTLAVRSSTPPRKKARLDDTTTMENVSVASPDSEVSDEDCAVAKRKNVRRKGRKVSLRESSSESEAMSEEEPIRKVSAKKVSVMKAITAVSRDHDVVDTPSSTPPSNSTPNSRQTPPTKGKTKQGGQSDKSSTMGDGDDQRHGEFVKKVGLLRDNARDRDLDSGESSNSRGEHLEPCALAVPKGAKLTPFEEQVVAIKKLNPSTVRFVPFRIQIEFLVSQLEFSRFFLWNVVTSSDSLVEMLRSLLRYGMMSYLISISMA